METLLSTLVTCFAEENCKFLPEIFNTYNTRRLCSTW